MTTILDPQRCVVLTCAIAGSDNFQGGFLDAKDFGMFVSGLDDNFDLIAPADQPFDVQVLRYVKTKNVRGQIGDLLDRLADLWSEGRNDLFEVVKELVNFINTSDAGPSWFLSYASFEKDRLADLEREGVFDYFREFLRRPASNPLSGLSDVLRDEMNRSRFFVALVGQFYKNSNNATKVFETAFANWLNRLSGDSSLHQRLIVLLLDKDGRSWWESNYEKRVPPGGKSLVKSFDAGLGTLKTDLENWLGQNSNDPEKKQQPPPTAPKSVLVLGEPKGAAVSEVSTAVDDLVSYLVGRAPALVDFWQDGWSKDKPVSDEERNERARIFAKCPLFVRTIGDREATIREVQAELKPHLLSAFGFSFDDTDKFDKLQRLYWRPAGPEWIGDGPELGWIGQTQDFGARLAELAGFPNKPDRRAIVRYEDPRSDDEGRTKRNRELVVTSLQLAARHGAGPGVVPNTVPISYEKIEDSIKKFTRNGLNVIALHDLEALPLDEKDTIRRFEGADKRIDNAINGLFGSVERIPILRVAVLLKNAIKFDGLKFDQESSVWRWNLLKCPLDALGRPECDKNDFENIASEARGILAKAAD